MKLYFIIVFFLISRIAFTQATVYGQIKSSTGEFISVVEVFDEQSKTIYDINSDGQFQIENLALGSRDFIFLLMDLKFYISHSK